MTDPTKGQSMTSSETEPPSNESLRLQYWAVERLIPSAHNARTHSDTQVAEIAGSIRAFGFANPILVGPEGDVIAGHGRLAAARKLGLREVPFVVLSGLNELQRRQLMLADNRIALNAGWDAAMLQLELKDLAALGSDLAALGFTTQELARALAPSRSGLTGEDELPEFLEHAVSRPGDIWCAGSHRLGCGNSTERLAVVTLLGALKPELMVTDPPYGVGYDPAWRAERGLSASGRR